MAGGGELAIEPTMGLKAVELLMAVEEEFGIEIPYEVGVRVLSVGDLYGALVQILESRGEASDKEDIWTHLRELIVQHLGVRPEEVVPTAQFVRDLHAD